MTLNEKLREIRTSKGISQTFMAQKLEMSVQGYNMKERGKRPITTKELQTIADILEVNPAIFFQNKIHVKLNYETA